MADPTKIPLDVRINPRRLHSTLGYRSPDEAERGYHDQPAATASTSIERAA